MRRWPLFSDTLTVDEITTMSDQEAVRRRFDVSNIRLFGALTPIFFLTAAAQLMICVAHREAPHLLPVAIVHFAFALVAGLFFGELSYDERKRGTWKPRMPVHILRRNLSAWVVSYLIIEFALLTAFRT